MRRCSGALRIAAALLGEAWRIRQLFEATTKKSEGCLRNSFEMNIGG
jgi:hypothetical protein